MRCLLCTLALVLLVGCRSQSTAMTNPFLAPNRVPPPATRTLLPGTAQPYYPGDPIPNSPAIAAPPAGFAPGTTLQPGFQPTMPTYAPQPAGVVPPRGWNTAPQPIPRGSSSRNVLPSNIQPASAVMPMTVESDQQSLRFGQLAPPPQQPAPIQSVSQVPNQFASFQTPLPQQPSVQQSAPIAEPREVRIRAISSNYQLSNDGTTVVGSQSSDGFRPQGSSRVRKPTIASRLVPRKRGPARETSERYGFEPQYQWLRGTLQYAETTGRWSLQYVPGQGIADPFGGNLTIANPQVLGDLQPGDFVQLRGQVDQNQAVPAYTVSVVQRQRI